MAKVVGTICKVSKSAQSYWVSKGITDQEKRREFPIVEFSGEEKSIVSMFETLQNAVAELDNKLREKFGDDADATVVGHEALTVADFVRFLNSKVRPVRLSSLIESGVLPALPAGTVAAPAGDTPDTDL